MEENFEILSSGQNSLENLKIDNRDAKGSNIPEWLSAIEILSKIDPHILTVVSRKMMNYLLYRGYEPAKEIFAKIGLGNSSSDKLLFETNRPSQKRVLKNMFAYSNEIFQLASCYLKEEEIFYLIQKWIHEEKASSLVKLLANQSVSIKEIAEEIRKYYIRTLNIDEVESRFNLSPALQGIRVSLARRLLSDQLEYVHIAKNFITIKDFYEILQKTIITTEGMGRLGGKAAGLILSRKIIETYVALNPQISEPDARFALNKIKVPKTWFIPSDSFYDFLYFNNLEDIIEQKYKPLNEIRNEYSNIIQIFKNSQFPPELVNGLSRALDDFGRHPLIVRSSSLLEDRLGASFPGKYKSIFLANQGTKEERLSALMDAIAEVYASTFSPDPIGYRIEHGLLDFNEEMGIMIQEVVGKKVGKYFFPAFAGVAFSLNEFRWSPRINREDGLVRIVPGLGTRAVDRIGDDYPILASPGQPNLKVYTTLQDYLLYSPKKIDVINLETNSFEALNLDDLIEEVGNDFPVINLVFSIIEDRQLRNPVGLGINTKENEVVVTFENLFNTTTFLKTISKLLKILRNELQVPVDIEFACDGENLYILQCRSQSALRDNLQAVIPQNIPREDSLFTATKFISDGKVPDIEYIVYVDPVNYSRLANLQEYLDVGEAVGELNKILPRKKFILIGPGRWGTRDDVRLGVKVTYSYINNTALLIEVAHKVGNYVPDLSFGTHFFQDLVESDIKYIPIFPDEESTFFNEFFIQRSQNLINNLIENFSHISHVVKVINVPRETGGKILRVLMNGNQNIAVGYFVQSSISPLYLMQPKENKTDLQIEEPWEIRWKFAEKVANALDMRKFGVRGIYIFGTVHSKVAKETSDVDLLIHFDGDETHRCSLEAWFDVWNQILQELIYYQTGFKPKKALDVHFITDAERVPENYFYSEVMNPQKKLSTKLR
jgi:predicted nucleotidyltransferase